MARQKLWESVGSAVGGGDRDWVMQKLLPLIGAEQPEGDGQNENFSAWRRYLEGLAEQHPLVLVFEDLHWADDGLLDFVDNLADWSSGVPLFVVGTARPELLDRRAGWGGGKLNATTLALSPLADAEAAQIISRVLEQALLPADTQQLLLERAGGNPLYAEQFARLYVERGSAEDLPLPETIQGIIAARLDGLAPDEKRLLQDAAVLGKVFWSGGAAALAGLDAHGLEHALHSLERKGLVRRERRSAVSGEDEFAFRHVLVRDVAYGQIPRVDRGQKHVRAAQWIEGLGRTEDHAEHVAHHYGAAIELARAAGSVDPTLEEASRVAFVRAGVRGYRLGAFPAASAFLRGRARASRRRRGSCPARVRSRTSASPRRRRRRRPARRARCAGGGRSTRRGGGGGGTRRTLRLAFGARSRGRRDPDSRGSVARGKSANARTRSRPRGEGARRCLRGSNGQCERREHTRA